MQYEKMSNRLIKDSIFARRGVPEDVIYTLGTYHKYWLDKEHGVRNPAFDRYSSNILDLKRGKKAAVEYFYNILEKIIPDDENLMICVVPSSEPGAIDAGIKKLCRQLADNRHLIDGTDVLIRSKRIKKLASGGNRSEYVHYDSIEIGWGNVRNEVRSSECFFGELMIEIGCEKEKTASLQDMVKDLLTGKENYEMQISDLRSLIQSEENICEDIYK